MDNRAYWIWMQQAFGAGSPLPWRIHRSVPGGVEAFYQGGPRLWNSLGGIREQEAAALFSFSLEEAQAQLEHALKSGLGGAHPGVWGVSPGADAYLRPARGTVWKGGAA